MKIFPKILLVAQLEIKCIQVYIFLFDLNLVTVLNKCIYVVRGGMRRYGGELVAYIANIFMCNSRHVAFSNGIIFFFSFYILILKVEFIEWKWRQIDAKTQFTTLGPVIFFLLFFHFSFRFFFFIFLFVLEIPFLFSMQSYICHAITHLLRHLNDEWEWEKRMNVGDVILNEWQIEFNIWKVVTPVWRWRSSDIRLARCSKNFSKLKMMKWCQRLNFHCVTRNIRIKSTLAIS